MDERSRLVVFPRRRKRRKWVQQPAQTHIMRENERGGEDREWGGVHILEG
jgi:hypothetical protein